MKRTTILGAAGIYRTVADEQATLRKDAGLASLPSIPLAAGAPVELVPKFCRQLVFLARDGFSKLFLQGPADMEMLAKRFPQLHQAADELVIVELFFRFVFDEDLFN